MFKSTIFPVSLSSCFSERHFLFHVFEISAGEGCPSWQAISFVKCSACATLFSELCPWGSPLQMSHVSMEEPSHHPSLCQGRGCFWKQKSLHGPLLQVSVVGAVSVGVFMHGHVCLGVHFPPKDNKTATLVNFLEINCFEGHYFNKRDKILPNPLSQPQYSLKK